MCWLPLARPLPRTVVALWHATHSSVLLNVRAVTRGSALLLRCSACAFVTINVPRWQLAQSSVSGVPQLYVARSGARLARSARWQGFVPPVPHELCRPVDQLPL
jgi:hypothetical protein